MHGAQRSLPSVNCPFCTNNLSIVNDHTDDPFALVNLLPAGTIPIRVHARESACPHAANITEWHSISFNRPKETLFQDLAFLAKHLFLRATCRLAASRRTVFIRVYLIPNDLPNARGQLYCLPGNLFKEARQRLQRVITLIERTPALWDADETHLTASPAFFLPSHIDNRTMAEIYSDLPSPILASQSTHNQTLAHMIASGSKIWGLRSSLYPYQRHSVAIMVNKETNTAPVPDPLYICVSCISGVNCYVQPSTMTVLRERPLVASSRAGILCEELGTGKTVIILSLILATVDQLPDPEESLCDERLVMTPMAYRHFPSGEHVDARARAGLTLDGSSVTQPVPSLVELLIHHIRVAKVIQGRQEYADELEASHLWPLIRANIPFYHHYDETPFVAQILKRSARLTTPELPPRTIYLTSATLVVVPLMLMGQWRSEIQKHCHDHVRHLIVRSFMDLPNARTLASEYDLIVMSDICFRIESKKNKIQELHHIKPCTCPDLAGSHVPDCLCPGHPEVTPLLQIRWKRFIIDEGHNTANTATSLNHFVKQLSIECKWIVTGTPTSNILGLSLGHMVDDAGSSHDGLTELVSTDIPGSPVPSGGVDDHTNHIHIWGSYDNINLRKLGNMIGDFLGFPQFQNNPESFSLHVSTPLCNQHGPHPGAIDILTQVMQTVMVRHRIDDVERDIILPHMKQETIYLDLDEYGLKSYNALQAGVVINAIDSERTGPDYIFHPSKAKDLQTTLNNSSQCLFWSSSEYLYNVDEICKHAEEYLARAIERQIPAEDLELLQQALSHAAVAANNDLWRGMQPYVDIPFVVSGLCQDIFHAWTRVGLDSDNRSADFMHAPRLVNLRSVARERPLITTEQLVHEGCRVKMNECKRMSARSSRSRGAQTLHSSDQAKEMAHGVQGVMEALQKRAEGLGVPDDPDETQLGNGTVTGRVDIGGSSSRSSALLSHSVLQGAKVGRSLSTKMNYILSEILQYSSQEKFLIFSSSLLTLVQIYDGLALFDIKCLRFTNEDHHLLREQCITTFESSDLYRVLLIDLKLGARGLNLTSASRVIFCEPVWHPDVESQAIKRAHRIGQTRPVTVKTLVIRSTAEEAMINRRQYFRNSDKVPDMTTENGIRQYLENPRFLNTSSTESSNLSISLADTPVAYAGTDSNKPTVGGSSNAVGIDLAMEVVHNNREHVEAPVRKRVRFE